MVACWGGRWDGAGRYPFLTAAGAAGPLAGGGRERRSRSMGADVFGRKVPLATGACAARWQGCKRQTACPRICLRPPQAACMFLALGPLRPTSALLAATRPRPMAGLGRNQIAPWVGRSTSRGNAGISPNSTWPPIGSGRRRMVHGRRECRFTLIPLDRDAQSLRATALPISTGSGRPLAHRPPPSPPT